METYAVRPYSGRYGDFDISTLFWGTLVFLALFAFCLFAWKAIGRLRNRRKSDDVAVDAGEPWDPWDRAISRPPGDQYYGDECGGLGGMNQREQEEIFSTYAPRKVRKAMRQRRKAREEHSKGPY